MKAHTAALLLTLAFPATAQNLFNGFGAPSPPTPIRPGTQWVAQVNVALVAGNPTTLQINLPDRSFVATRRFFDNNDQDAIIWNGADQRSEVVLVITGGVLGGFVSEGADRFDLSVSGSGNILRWVDEDAVGDEPPPPVPPIAHRRFTPPVRTTHAAVLGGPATIDILVLYTQAAADAVGAIGMINTINSAVAVSNNALIQSNANVRFRVVAIALAPGGLIDSGSIEQDLISLEASAAVANLRDDNSADLVSLIINDAGLDPFGRRICGYAYIMGRNQVGPQFAPLGLSIVRRDCAVGDLVFAHEVGHNLGLEHNPEKAQSLPAASFDWSFGRVMPGTVSGFRDLMSGDFLCPPQECSMIARFSTPQLTWPVTTGTPPTTTQVPIGVANEKDHVRTLNITGLVAAKFREPDPIFANGLEL
jgi:hypothetical protein